MSGHNRWTKIKHKKGASDAKRGNAFTKILKEITVAARLGGGDPAGNPRLRAAILASREVNMPKDNVERAIKKGTGELEGASYEEVTYEGYGPGGVAILVDAMTDNRNRTVQEIRHMFAKYSGSMGESNSVAWMFEKRGYLSFPGSAMEEDAFVELALDLGVDDVATGEELEMFTAPADFLRVKEAVEAKGLKPDTAEVAMIPKTTVPLSADRAGAVMRFVEVLEEHDDVQHVWANLEVTDDVVAAG